MDNTSTQLRLLVQDLVGNRLARIHHYLGLCNLGTLAAMGVSVLMAHLGIWDAAHAARLA